MSTNPDRDDPSSETEKRLRAIESWQTKMITACVVGGALLLAGIGLESWYKIPAYIDAKVASLVDNGTVGRINDAAKKADEFNKLSKRNIFSVVVNATNTVVIDEIYRGCFVQTESNALALATVVNGDHTGEDISLYVGATQYTTTGGNHSGVFVKVKVGRIAEPTWWARITVYQGDLPASFDAKNPTIIPYAAPLMSYY